MGYQTTFRLKKELDSKFKSFRSKPSDGTEKSLCKMLLTAECMKYIRPVIAKKNDEDKEITVNYTKLYKAINWQVRYYALTLQQDWKYCIEQRLKNNNNEIWFCGWEYSEGFDRSITSWDSFDDVVIFFTEQLFLNAMQLTNSPFDDDHDDYYTKLQNISDDINEIEDAVNKVMDQEFFDFYRNNEELADESDGYNHQFPEEKDEEDTDNEEVKEVNEVGQPKPEETIDGD